MPGTDNIGAYLGQAAGYRLDDAGWKSELALSNPLKIRFCRGNFDVWDLYQPTANRFDFQRLDRIVDLIEASKTNDEIQAATGRGLTKICEIRRNPVRKPVEKRRGRAA